MSYKSFKQIYKEEFCNGYKSLNGSYQEVFVNPTKKEISQFDNYIRYIIDLEDQKIYVWGGDGNIHTSMLKFLHKDGILSKLPSTNDEEILIPTISKYIQGVIADDDYSSDILEMFSLGDFVSFDASPEDKQKIKVQFDKLSNMDLSWINKYPLFNYVSLKRMIRQYRSYLR